MRQRLLPSTLKALGIGLEMPSRLRTESGLTEHVERREYATGPFGVRLVEFRRAQLFCGSTTARVAVAMF